LAALARLPPLVLAALLAAWNLAFGLPYLFRPDEDVMVGRAVHMAAGHSLDPLFYIYPPFVFDLFAAAEAVLAAVPGQHLGPATATAAVWAAQRADSRRSYLAAGALAGLAGASKYTAGAALAYVLIRALTGPRRAASALSALLGCLLAIALVMLPAGHLGGYWDGLGFLLGRSREFAYMPPGWW